MQQGRPATVLPALRAPCLVIVLQINVAWQIEKLVGRKSLRRAWPEDFPNTKQMLLHLRWENARRKCWGDTKGEGRQEGLSMPVSVLKYVRTSTFNFDGVADLRVLLLLLLLFLTSFSSVQPR